MIDFILRNKITTNDYCTRFLKKEAVLGLSWGESRDVQGVKMEAESFVKEGRDQLNLKRGT